MELSDHDLLNRFSKDADAAAFQELVKRHLPLVHGVARRVTTSEELAKDVAQDTFIRLARRATLIPQHLSLAAWLHRTSRSLAIDLIRSETSRKKHEMNASDFSIWPTSDDATWEHLAPVIDELISHLPGSDRDAVLLRFYQNLSYPLIGLRLGITEEAARQRSLRALERLRTLLRKRGIVTTAAALSQMLPAHAATGVPASVTAAVFGAAQGITPILPHGYLSRLLRMTSTHKTSLACAVLMLAATTAYTRPWESSVTAMSPLLPASSSVASADATGPARTRSPGVSTEDRLEVLRRILDMDDLVERRRSMLDFVDQLSVAQFGSVSKFLMSLNRWDRQTEENMLAHAWTRADPLAALSYGMKHGKTDTMLHYWASIDPDATLDWMRENLTNSNSVSLRFKTLLAPALAGIAENDPARALALLNEFTLPPPSADGVPDRYEDKERLNQLGLLYFNMGESRDALDRLMNATQDEVLRSELVVAAAEMIAQKDPSQGAKLLEEFPGAANANAPCTSAAIDVFRNWTQKEPQAAADSVVNSSQEFREIGLSTVSLMLADQGDMPTVIGMLERCQPSDYSSWVKEMIGMVIKADDPGIAAINDRFSAIGNADLRDQMLEAGLKLWLTHDPDAADAWMDAHPVSGSVRSKLSQH